jgi:hypothetical protein
MKKWNVVLIERICSMPSVWKGKTDTGEEVRIAFFLNRLRININGKNKVDCMISGGVQKYLPYDIMRAAATGIFSFPRYCSVGEEMIKQLYEESSNE